MEQIIGQGWQSQSRPAFQRLMSLSFGSRANFDHSVLSISVVRSDSFDSKRILKGLPTKFMDFKTKVSTKIVDMQNTPAIERLPAINDESDLSSEKYQRSHRYQILFPPCNAKNNLARF